MAASMFTVTAALVNYHDGIVAKHPISLQDYVAPAALAMMLLLVLANALVSRLAPRSSLRVGELSLVLSLLLLTAPLPRFFALNLTGNIGATRSLIDSRNPAAINLQKANPYAVLPDSALLGLEDSRQFERGLPVSTPGGLGFGQVPWQAWRGPLLFWAPLSLTFLAFSVSLGCLLYQQWAKHELVPFPLADISAAMLARRSGKGLPDIMRLRLFWAGVVLMCVLFGLLGMARHNELVIFVPTKFELYQLAAKFPFLNYSLEGYSLLRGVFYFTMIAVAFLLASELSFSAWFMWVGMVVATYGYYLQTGVRFTGQNASLFQMGAWLGMACVILYTGRWFYLGVLRAALGATRIPGVDATAVWLARVLVASTILLALAIRALGVPWDLTLLWVALVFIFLLVLCRLVAEMGIPWVPLSGVAPLSIMLASLGEAAIGAKALALLSIINNMTLPTHVTMLPVAPAACNATHVEQKLTGRSSSLKVVGVFVPLALLVSIVMLIWIGYAHPSQLKDLHSIEDIGASARSIARMGPVDGNLSNDLPFPSRLAKAAAVDKFWALFGVGFGGVMVIGALRLRFPRFPLHPLPMVLLGSWLLSRFWFSFLVGWLIKKAVLKIGGATLYEECRPFFIGIVAGQALICLVWMFANIAIFWTNGCSFDPAWWSFMTDIYSS